MLSISENRRFLVHKETGDPFFYLGDTAWELFHRLTRDEIAEYLERRSEQGFTVIQAVCLAECDGLTEPNREGHLPLHDLDPTRPNEAYFDLVDWVVKYAAHLDMHIGLLPTWGDKVNLSTWGKGPLVFTPENAFVYGQFLGRRYKDAPVIWINGGDRKVENEQQAEIWRQIARGLKDGDESAHLITFHPNGRGASSDTFHNEPWLDFNMIQSGHNGGPPVGGTMIAADYARAPVKACMDGEPRYEDHPIDFNVVNGRFTTRDIRDAAYRALFAGAHGHTYGCHDVWQFFDPACHPAINGAHIHWRDALELPAAQQMVHVKNLLLSRPYLRRAPAPELLFDPAQTPAPCATQDANGSYAFVYVPRGDSVRVSLDGLANGKLLQAWCFNPRTGEADSLGVVAAFGAPTFTPTPFYGLEDDWVLVLDDVSANFPPPVSVAEA